MTPLRAINDCFKWNCTEEEIQDAKASCAPAKAINCSSTLELQFVCLFGCFFLCKEQKNVAALNISLSNVSTLTIGSCGNLTQEAVKQ